jgi:4-hydroxybenzoate polyprenyltransferase
MEERGASVGEMVLLTDTHAVASGDSTKAAAPDPVPLVVDLDGTLLRTNSLIESLFVLARTKPSTLFKLPVWWMRGRALFKHRLAAAVMPDVHWLPFRVGLLEFLREQKRLGRTLILATGADEKLAREVDREVGLFDDVKASDGIVDLSGERKRDRLVADFGPRGFDYIGHDGRDYEVWCSARRALLASPSPHLLQIVGERTPVEKVFTDIRARWQDYLDALRPLHWVKNTLVFVPLVAVHRVFEFALVGRALLAFIAFNMCASGLYLLNDLLDLPADRRHPQKKTRMLAAGRIPLGYALLMMPILTLGAFAVGSYLSIAFAGVLALYTALMIGYSMRLKDIALVDVLVLAGGYALRVAAGAAASDIRISAWLLTLCVFLFFSLALIKRYAELIVLESEPGGGSAHARGYLGTDKVVLVAQGIASGYLAVMVLALYTNTPISQHLYAHHDYFWGVCLLLLYWVSYLWMAATRGRIAGDPVIFALSDRGSRWTIVGMGLLAALSI